MKKKFIKKGNCDAADEEFLNKCPISKKLKNKKKQKKIYKWFMKKCISQNKASSMDATRAATIAVTEKPAQAINCDPHYLCSSHTSATYLRKQMGFKSSTECKKNICTGRHQNIHAKTESWLRTNQSKKKKEGHCPSYYRVFDKTTGRVSCSKSTGSSTSKKSDNSSKKNLNK